MNRCLLVLFILCAAPTAHAENNVRTVDFLDVPNIDINAAGPMLVRMDVDRNRLIVANTLTSSLTLIDCPSRAVRNIPIGGRALQHLKSESMTHNRRTGDVYLIGTKSIFFFDSKNTKTAMIATGAQFESIAVDEHTGHAWLAGRESKPLGVYEPGTTAVKTIEWLDTSEVLINLNQTPPPPIRKVIVDNLLRQMIAVDGGSSTLFLFDSAKRTLLRTRPLDLEPGGRWHLAGYDETAHALYLVTETNAREVTRAARIDVTGENDVAVVLPGLKEGVGITYNPRRKEVYIAYDNHPTVHAVTFEQGGGFDEIKLPSYGNDAAVADAENDILYVASWAHGEVDVVDLDSRRMMKRITGLGIIPHMFAMAFNPINNRLYFPKGASAVNGTFGAAVTVLDPVAERTSKIHTGWAPIDLVEVPTRGTFFVFSNEDEFAEVRADGTFDVHPLPYDYPASAVLNAEGDVYLSYGPHQSYWPTVYIWGAKNGILTIDADDLGFYDRRIPRQAHKIVLDGHGVLYATQNNWGKEEQFIGILEDPVRLYEANNRLRLVDEVEREITQRILEYDPELNRLYLVRTGEKDEDPGILQVIDPAEGTVLRRIAVGRTPSDLAFDRNTIYVANFDSGTVSVIDKSSFAVREVAAGDAPLELCVLGARVFAVGHLDNRLHEVGENGRTYPIPFDGFPDNSFVWGGTIVITSHNADGMSVLRFDPASESFSTLVEANYPYGDTRFDTRNVSFYVRGQYGDAVFDISRAEADSGGRLWVTDFLAGKLYIIEDAQTRR